MIPLFTALFFELNLRSLYHMPCDIQKGNVNRKITRGRGVNTRAPFRCVVHAFCQGSSLLRLCYLQILGGCGNGLVFAVPKALAAAKYGC